VEQLLDKISKAPPMVRFGGLAGFVVAVTLLNFFVVVSSVDTKIQQHAAQQASLDTSLAEKQAIAQNLNEMRRQMDELEQQLQAALTELPEQKSIDELLGQLNDVGKKSGLDIAKVEPGEEAPAEFFSRIPIKVMVSGNYHEIAMFLQEIANMRRIVNVTNITMNAPTLKSDKVVLKSEFMATTFRFLDASAKGGDPNAAKPASSGGGGH
jgi:type IV pilus assembly protein PilO